MAILAFATPYNSKVLVFLQDQNASAIFGRFYGDGTTTALTIRCAAALTAGATYTIVYHVVGA